MPVVISEFEVVPAAEPPKERPPVAAEKPAPAATSADVERLLHCMHQRAVRLRAH
jgi:hypothetical protein